MALLKFVVCLALAAGCGASLPHQHLLPASLPHQHLLPAVRAPVVRYAPYYNFPSVVRSIHAISPAFPAALPVARAPLFTPLAPAPLAPAPLAPATFAPAPFLRAQYPAPVFPPPVLPAPPTYPALTAYPGLSVYNPALSAPTIALARALPHYARLAPAPLAPAPLLPAPVFRHGW